MLDELTLTSLGAMGLSPRADVELLPLLRAADVVLLVGYDYALPTAIGLSLASRRRVVSVMGDGGFEMVLGELATLRDLALPVVLIIFDDRSRGART